MNWMVLMLDWMLKFVPMHEDHVAFSDEKERKEAMWKGKKRRRTNWDEKKKKKKKTKQNKTKLNNRERKKKSGEKKKKIGHKKQGPPCEYIYENAMEIEFWKLKTPQMCFQFP